MPTELETGWLAHFHLERPTTELYVSGRSDWQGRTPLHDRAPGTALASAEGMACVWGGQTGGQVDSGTLRAADFRAAWPFLVLSAVLLTVLALLEWQAPSTPSAPVSLSPQAAETQSVLGSSF